MHTDVLKHLLETLAYVEPWYERISSPPVEPATGSSLAADDDATGPFHLSHAASGAIVSAVDHLNSLRLLLYDAHTLPSRATYTLLRSALENASTAVWLMAPSYRDERVLRRLRLQWAEDLDRAQALRLVGKDPTAFLQDSKTRLQKLAVARGLSKESVAKVAARPISYGSIVEAAGDACTMDTVSGSRARWLWGVSSGMAHGKWWAAETILARHQTRAMNDDIVHLQLGATNEWVLTATQYSVVITHDAWRLFDQRRQTYQWN